MNFHPFPPFIPKNASSIIIGTLPPPRFCHNKSGERIGELNNDDVDFYYGSRDNFFWTIIANVYSESLSYQNKQEAVEARKRLLEKNGLGILDMIRSFSRKAENASDENIEVAEYNEVLDLLYWHKNVNEIFFTSSYAEQLFNKYLILKGAKCRGNKIVINKVPKIREFQIDVNGNLRPLRTITLYSPSPRSYRRLKESTDLQYKRYLPSTGTGARRVIPEWELDSIALVYPHSLRGQRNKLKTFFRSFIQQVPDNLNLMILVANKEAEIDFKKHLNINGKLDVSISILEAGDIWIRDWAGIIVHNTNGKKEYIKFQYKPKYLTSSFEKELQKLDDKAGFELGEILNLPIVKSSIILDGGNFVHNGDGTGIVSNGVIADNEGLSIDQIRTEFEELLGINNLIFVPVEPDDFTGHVDGMIRFINGHTLAVASYPEEEDNAQFMDDLANSLKKPLGTEMNLIRIPNGPIDQGNNISALNNHLNFIRAKNTILMPFYGIPEDDLAVRAIKDVDPDLEVIPVKADDLDLLAKEGGVLNCISWSY